MQTGVSVRIFELLTAFVKAQEQFTNAFSDRESPYEQLVAAKLDQAIQATEDRFITYGEDTVDRAVAELQGQLELGTSTTNQNTIPTSNDSPLPTSKTFKIDKNLYLSTSTLMNDI